MRATREKSKKDKSIKVKQLETTGIDEQKSEIKTWEVITDEF